MSNNVDYTQTPVIEDDDKTPTMSYREFIQLEMDCLLQIDPFYANIGCYVQKLHDTGRCKNGYAYVTINNVGQIQMGFNGKLMSTLPKHQQQGVYKHEILHIALDHLTTRRPRGHSKLWNWATDLAINSIITEKKADALPDTMLFPGRARPGQPQKISDFFLNLPVLQSSEYYFDALLKLQNEMEEESDGNEEGENKGFQFNFGETSDDHSMWDDVPNDMKEYISERIKDIVLHLAGQADAYNGWGTIPMCVRETLRNCGKRKIDWKDVLSKFKGRLRCAQQTSTLKVINRRYPYEHPGHKFNYTASLYVYEDQSGSMSDEDLAIFHATLQGLVKESDRFVFLPFDTQVYEEKKTIWTKNNYSRVAFERVASGGTSYDDVARHANQHRGEVDGVIIHTDGYAAAMPKIYGVPVLWILTPNANESIIKPGDLVIRMSNMDKRIERF